MSTVETIEESIISDIEKKHLSEKLRDETAHLLLLSAHGSHLYGWAGTGSDMDLRGVYLADTRRKLGIRGHPADSILLPHSLDVDVEIHEVGKVIHESLKGNCNFLEFIHAPHLLASPEGRELADLLSGNFSKSGFYNCYSEDTELLTETGWKKFPDLNKDERVATLRKDGTVEYQIPTDYFADRYIGKMFHQGGKVIDVCVTPNHRMYVSKHSNCAWSDYYFISAEDLYNEKCEFRYKCWATWNNATSIDSMKIGEREIPMDKWLRFFGIWIAEGCMVKNNPKYMGYYVYITQKNVENMEIIKKIVEDCGFNYCENKGTYTLMIKNKALWTYLQQFGHSEDKYIPRYIFELPLAYREIFFMSYLMGDGHKSRDKLKHGWNGYNGLSTTSKRLADDMQEFILRLGLNSVLRWGKDCRISFGGYVSKPIYCVTINGTYLDTAVNKTKNNKEWVDYDGMVYCVSVPNGIILVRRNGKTCWCGNSYRGLAYHNYNKYIRGKATRGIEYDPFTEEWLNKTMTMREFLSHPDGFFRKEFERIKAWAKPKGKEPIKPTCKKYLYVYRSLMTAEVMFNTGDFVFDIRKLNDHFDYPEIDLLLGAKMKEKEALPADYSMDPVQLDNRINHLFGTMEAAYKASKLSDGPEPEVFEKLNNFVIGLRLDN